MSVCIPKSEFEARIVRLQQEMARRNLDALAVYGDEYRKENLRYVTNFWPIFERGMLFIPRSGAPVFAGAPEGEKYAAEQCIWSDLRNVKEFACVSVPDAIDYPLASFSSFREILGDMLKTGKKLGVVGTYDLPRHIYMRLEESVPGLELVESNDIMTAMRLIKTPAEIACLRQAGAIAGAAYKELIRTAVPGNTERFAAGAAEGVARQAGAEAVIFTVMGTGERAATVIGRATEKIIADGDMVMAALAIQYAGYVTTVEYPFVAGKASDNQKWFLNALVEAANAQYDMLRPGVVTGDMVKAVKAVFAKHKLTEYDVYPPMHGIGLAEAESPYPDENSTYRFEKGMCVNSDISLFGHPHGSNRIEEGFVFTDSGVESLTPVIRELLAKGI